MGSSMTLDREASSFAAVAISVSVSESFGS